MDCEMDRWEKYGHTTNVISASANKLLFLADFTNGRAYATMLRPSVVGRRRLWCMYCG